MFLAYNRIACNHLRRIRCTRFQTTSQHVEAKNPIAKSSDDGKTDIQHTKISESLDDMKTVFARQPKKPARLPLMKRLFSAKFDEELIVYPEVVNRSDMEDLYKVINKSKEFVSTSVDSEAIKKSGTVPSSVIDGLRQLGAFGIDVPRNFGGSEQFLTEGCYRIETEAEDINVSQSLNVHRLVTQILAEYGTDAQKSKFLPLLAKGDIIATVAFNEFEQPPEGFFDTKAKASTRDGDWSLNGKKSFVINAKNADLLLVVSEVKATDHLGDPADLISVFLIESDMPGVEISPVTNNTIGCKGLQQCDVTFNNVQLLQEHIIGTFKDGASIAQRLFMNSRLQAGIVTLVKMKNMINDLTKFCMDNSQFNIKFKDMDIFKDYLSKAVYDAYALESMIYLTTGIIDGYENAEVDVETAIIKVFSQQSIIKLATVALNFIGPKMTINDQPCLEYLKDTLHLATHSESIDTLLQFIGLSGLQYAGLELAVEVKKIRNPLMNPEFIFKKFFENTNIDSIKSTIHVNHHVHPSLDPAAQWLEHSIIRLQIGTEHLLNRYGLEIMDKQLEIKRLSECAILVYAMFASISRASRSYCIGLSHCDYEILIASTFCHDMSKKVKKLVHELEDGPYLTNDINRYKVAEKLFTEKGYFCTHPLTRNF